jgi:hypothetical protein
MLFPPFPRPPFAKIEVLPREFSKVRGRETAVLVPQCPCLVGVESLTLIILDMARNKICETYNERE